MSLVHEIKSGSGLSIVVIGLIYLGKSKLHKVLSTDFLRPALSTSRAAEVTAMTLGFTVVSIVFAIFCGVLFWHEVLIAIKEWLFVMNIIILILLLLSSWCIYQQSENTLIPDKYGHFSLSAWIILIINFCAWFLVALWLNLVKHQDTELAIEWFLATVITALTINPLGQLIALWALPPLRKFNHPNGTSYQGVILERTSQLLTLAEIDNTDHIAKIHFIPLGQQKVSLELSGIKPNQHRITFRNEMKTLRKRFICCIKKWRP